MKLNYRKIGSGEPVIIMHGLFGSADNWLTIARELEADYELYLLDLRNHGDSPKSEEWNYEVMAKDLKDFIEEHQLKNPAILGHSMGGKVAMFFATQYPELVSKLMVADIAPRYYPIHHHTILKGLNAIPIDSLKSRKEAEDILGEYVKDMGTRQFLLKSLGRASGGGFEWKINLPVITKQIENVGEALPEGAQFDKSTLFVRGANSDYINEDDSAEIKEIFTNSTLVTIKDAGHWLHAEQPEVFTSIFKEFLKS